MTKEAFLSTSNVLKSLAGGAYSAPPDVAGGEGLSGKRCFKQKIAWSRFALILFKLHEI